MKTLFVNLTGGPGTGKSTLMAKLFVALKLQGFSCEMVQEYAKELVWLGDLTAFENQHAVAKTQYEWLRSRQGKAQIVVTDGPLANFLYYNRHKEHLCDVAKTEQAILTWLAEFNNYTVFIERGDFPYEEQGRYQSESEAKAIDSVLLSEISQHMAIKSVSYPVDEEALVKCIVAEYQKLVLLNTEEPLN